MMQLDQAEYSNVYYENLEDKSQLDLSFIQSQEQNVVSHLYQNKPNPFSTKSTIGFDLGKAGLASIVVTDLSGKELLEISGMFEKGYNEVIINQAQLSTYGVLIVKLETSDYSAFRKMIVVQ